MIKNYLSLVKFSHTIFALPFAMIGFFWAWFDLSVNKFPFKLLFLVLLCMVFARNAAMGFNRYIDRKFDKQNQRTKSREIPAGIITPTAALVFVIVNCLLFCLTTFFINSLAFCLSFVALAVVLGYSYTKRFTSLCHFILGMGLAIAPTGAYIALTGEFALLPILLSGLVLFWVGGFDILYALPDDGFDKEYNLYSIPAWLGRKKSMILSITVHIIPAAIAILIGCLFNRGGLYWAGTIIFISLLIYQHTIVSPNNLTRLNAAFGTVNGIASVCFALFTISDLFLI